MNRKRLVSLGIVAAAAVLLAACAPTVTVQNDTSFPVRAIVTMPKVGRQVLSPSPGYSSTAEGSGNGPWRVTVIPDQEWLEYAKLKRQVLNDQLANADRLTGPQLLEVIRHLKEVAQQMQAFESAAGAGASCGGALTDEVGSGLAVVSQTPDGKLVVSCK